MTDARITTLAAAELFSEHPQEAAVYYEWLLDRSSPLQRNPSRPAVSSVPNGASPGWVPLFSVDSIDDAIASAAPHGVTHRELTNGNPTRHYAAMESGFWIGLEEHDDEERPPMSINVDCATRDAEHMSDLLQELLSVHPLDAVDDPYAMRLLRAGRTIVTGVLRMNSVTSLSTPTSWVVYFGVEDLVTTVARANESGSRVVVPPSTSPFDRYAILRDPWGHIFGLASPFEIETYRDLPVRSADGRTGAIGEFVDAAVRYPNGR